MSNELDPGSSSNAPKPPRSAQSQEMDREWSDLLYLLEGLEALKAELEARIAYIQGTRQNRFLGPPLVEASVEAYTHLNKLEEVRVRIMNRAHELFRLLESDFYVLGTGYRNQFELGDEEFDVIASEWRPVAAELLGKPVPDYNRVWGRYRRPYPYPKKT